MDEKTDMLTLDINDYGEYRFPAGTKLSDIIAETGIKLGYPILAAKINNELCELHRAVTEDCHIEFLDLTNPEAFRIYRRTCIFIMVYAAKTVIGKKKRIVVKHSMNSNYYCEIQDSDENGNPIEVNDELLAKIEGVMRETVEKDILIKKHSLLLGEGIAKAKEMGLTTNVRTLKYRRSTFVNFYQLDWYYDYFFGALAPSTGCIDRFKLSKQNGGFVLQFPSQKKPETMSEILYVEKMYQIFNESAEWARILKADTVGALCDIICSGEQSEFIRTNESLHEKRIAQIADMIAKEQKRIVLIAGPSSSGKTTFAERLCIQLRVNGLKPHVVSLDNYFYDASTVQIDEYGMPDFEAFEHVNSKLLNEHLSLLLEGKTVQLPKFDFNTGKSGTNGKLLTLEENDVLILEGIHGLNERLTYSVPKEYKFKIFISAITQLNMDDHNRIPAADTRLLRRIVRDHKFRNYSAEKTIAVWPSVTRGEEKHIFPFQDDADVMFNSSLVYELCVIKLFVEPLLFNIKPEQPEYMQARRLIKFLDSFLGITSEGIPETSIIREFIGGSCFHT